MAIKISQLYSSNPANTIQSGDLFEISRSGVSFGTTSDAIAAFANSLVVPINIFNNNGSLTSNRTLSANTFNLTFNASLAEQFSITNFKNTLLSTNNCSFTIADPAFHNFNTISGSKDSQINQTGTSNCLRNFIFGAENMLIRNCSDSILAACPIGRLRENTFSAIVGGRRHNGDDTTNTGLSFQNFVGGGRDIIYNKSSNFTALGSDFGGAIQTKSGYIIASSATNIGLDTFDTDYCGSIGSTTSTFQRVNKCFAISSDTTNFSSAGSSYVGAIACLNASISGLVSSNVGFLFSSSPTAEQSINSLCLGGLNPALKFANNSIIFAGTNNKIGNLATVNSSYVFGTGAEANHSFCTVFNTSGTLTTTNSNQFLLGGYNKVGFNTIGGNGIRYAFGGNVAAGGGISVPSDTQANIISLVPAGNCIMYATDTGQYLGYKTTLGTWSILG